MPDPTGSPAERPSLQPEYIALARNLARKYHAAGHDPGDLAQEALLAVMLALPVHTPDKGPIEAYLTVCVRSHLSRLTRCDHRRARLHEPTGDDWLDRRPGHEPDPALAAEHADFWEHARSIWPARQAEVIERIRQGESVAQIAEALGMTAEAVRQAQHRAIARLREAA